jgi:hypothetical protein
MSLLNFNSGSRRVRKKRAAIALIAIGATAGVLSLGFTFAARITLNNNGTTEFGQGFLTTTTCDTNGIKVTPINSFYNKPGPAYFTFNAIQIEEISANCEGKDFIIKVYNQNGQALEITNDKGTAFYEARVYFQPFTNSIQLSENDGVENTVSPINGSWDKQFTWVEEVSTAILVGTLSNLREKDPTRDILLPGRASEYFELDFNYNAFQITFDPSGAMASGFTDSKNVYHISVESVDHQS